MASFLEAIRRDDSRQIYRALSENFKERQELTGALEFELAWRRFREENGYLHLLGLAEVCDSEKISASLQAYELALSGRRFRVVLRRQNYLSLHYQPDWVDEPIAEERYIESLAPFMKVLPPGDDGTTIQFALTEIQFEGLTPSELHRAELGREWKVDSISEIIADS